MRLSVLLLAATAAASGLDAPAVGSPFSGPATVDAAALYWNPAQLGHVQAPTLQLGVGLVAGQLAYERERRGQYQYEDNFDIAEPIAPTDLDGSKTGRAEEVTAGVLSPTGDLFVAIPLTRGAGLGIGAYAPYAAPVEWPEDGPQRWALQEVFLAMSHVSAGFGIEVVPEFSLGASFSYVHGTASLKRVQDFAAVDDFGEALGKPPIDQRNDFGIDAPSTVRELDVLGRPFSFTDGTAHSFTFNIGIASRPVDDLVVGLTYDHGYDLEFEGDFALDMSDDFFTRDLAALGMQFEPLVEGKGTLKLSMPQRVMLGASYDFDAALRGLLRIEWVRWSALKDLRIHLESPELAQPEVGLPPTSDAVIDRSWEDAVHLELGGRYAALATLGISAALGYQSPASPDSTVDVASPDGHRLIGTMGLDWAFTRNALLRFDARLGGILPREVTTSQNDLGNGTYNLFLALVAAHVEVRFGGDDDAS